MEKQKVLFVCIHNSARSQMAEAFLKDLAGDRFDVKSAGLEPGILNPIVVEAVKEIGIDISNNKTKSVFDLFEKHEQFHYVIAVCDKEAADRCPNFPSLIEKLHWSFEDPSAIIRSYIEKLEKTRQIRDKIKNQISGWIKEKLIELNE